MILADGFTDRKYCSNKIIFLYTDHIQIIYKEHIILYGTSIKGSNRFKANLCTVRHNNIFNAIHGSCLTTDD